jgi:ATP-dependent Lhr-like helicase
MEEAGRVRRGYFVEGLGGSQFAEPGALERLRAAREIEAEAEERAAVLPATDPANPWGALLPWPEETRFQRVAGAHVVLVGGRLVAWVSRGERDAFVLLPEDEPQRSRAGQGAATALAAWCQRTSRPTIGWGDDGPSLARGPLAPFLRDAGFEPSGPGFRLAKRPG